MQRQQQPTYERWGDCIAPLAGSVSSCHQPSPSHPTLRLTVGPHFPLPLQASQTATTSRSFRTASSRLYCTTSCLTGEPGGGASRGGMRRPNPKGRWAQPRSWAQCLAPTPCRAYDVDELVELQDPDGMQTSLGRATKDTYRVTFDNNTLPVRLPPPPLLVAPPSTSAAAAAATPAAPPSPPPPTCTPRPATRLLCLCRWWPQEAGPPTTRSCSRRTRPATGGCMSWAACCCRRSSGETALPCVLDCRCGCGWGRSSPKALQRPAETVPHSHWCLPLVPRPLPAGALTLPRRVTPPLRRCSSLPRLVDDTPDLPNSVFMGLIDGSGEAPAGAEPPAPLPEDDGSGGGGAPAPSHSNATGIVVSSGDGSPSNASAADVLAGSSSGGGNGVLVVAASVAAGAVVLCAAVVAGVLLRKRQLRRRRQAQNSRLVEDEGEEDFQPAASKASMRPVQLHVDA